MLSLPQTAHLSETDLAVGQTTPGAISDPCGWRHAWLDVESQQGLRQGAYLSFETWSRFVTAAGFKLLEHYYRPPQRPRTEQPWLATLWRAC